MFVEAQDNRPPSMLTTDVWSRSMVTGGAIIAILAHVIIPGATILVMGLLAATGIAETDPTTYIEDNVVVAEFVRKGVKRDPNKLPDRIVPRKSTAPDKSTVVSKNMDPPKPKKEEEERPEDPEDDLLTRLGDRAQAFAEIAEEREQEGDPDGIEGGTATEAKAGDIYAGKLKVFFERGWTIPTTLGDTSHLVTVAEVQITRDLKVGPSRIVKSSGDPVFDQSVEDRFEQLRRLGTTVPEPPPEIADTYLGNTVGLRFKGKKAN